MTAEDYPMTRLVLVIVTALSLVACAANQPVRSSSQTAGASGEMAGASAEPAGASGGMAGASAEPAGASGGMAGASAEPAGAPEERESKDAPHRFKENRTGTPGLDRGVKPSALKPTRTEAALKFTVIDKDKGPIPGIVIKLTDPEGRTYYTEETDAKGYAEVLVPVGQEYEVVYLSLGRHKIAAKLPVEDEPSQTMRLTLRYKRYDANEGKHEGLVLEGVHFDSGKATLRPGSYAKLDRVAEYMKYKKSARIEISGHTDNVGNAKRNKALSKRRAQACRRYLISKGIDAGRIRAVGYGEERPIASNDTPAGRQKNRRIEATEL
jgi:outer membrane protein OmpA-like peptidoglycan-associated protein